MKEVKVVIGKNFGDEGKGAMVHKLSRNGNSIVVRHNGGAQAGHTVEEGAFRFVFHQLGSGSRNGCPTYWSHTFLPDLLKLGEEAEDFVREMYRADACHGIQTHDSMRYKAGMSNGAKIAPVIYASPDCRCTVIYDVLLNSLKEVLRGEEKHGSCGMGIYESVVRSMDKKFVLNLADLKGACVSDIVDKLNFIRREYSENCIMQLRKEYAEVFGRPEVQQWLELFYDENICRNAATEMWENFQRYVVLKEWDEIKKDYETIIFENAQGLMLDCDNSEYYPHLTPSHTGLHNIKELFAGEESEIALEVVYVTRTYMTRHGRGRLDHECSKAEINAAIVDKTNVPNPWQDALRYAGHPGGEEFFRYMLADLKHLDGLVCFKKIDKTLYVNHLDETGGEMVFADGKRDMDELKYMCRKFGMEVLESEGIK